MNLKYKADIRWKRGKQELELFTHNLKTRCCIAGSYAIALYYVSPPFEPGDMDVYVNTQEKYQELSNYLYEDLRAELFETRTFGEIMFVPVMSRKINLTLAPIQTIGELLDTFDINLCKIAYAPSINKLTFGDDFMRGLNRIQLGYVHTPIIHFARLVKYIKRGYLVDYKQCLDTLLVAWEKQRDIVPHSHRPGAFNQLVPVINEAARDNAGEQMTDDYGFLI